MSDENQIDSNEEREIRRLEARAGGMLPGIAAISMFMIFMTILNAFAALRGTFGLAGAKYSVLAVCTLLAVGVFSSPKTPTANSVQTASTLYFAPASPNVPRNAAKAFRMVIKIMNIEIAAIPGSIPPARASSRLISLSSLLSIWFSSLIECAGMPTDHQDPAGQSYPPGPASCSFHAAPWLKRARPWP